MRRVILLSIIVFIFQAAWQSISLYLPLFFDVFLIAPLILVFTLQYFRMIEIVFICIISGILIDSLSSNIIGVNVLLMLVFAFNLGFTTIFLGRKTKLELIIHVPFISFLYRLGLIFFQVIFQAQTGVIYFSLFFGPIIDTLVSVVFFNISARIMVLAKVFQQHDYFGNRIGPPL